MDELERLVNVYRARGSSSVKSKLDVLMNLELIRDPRVVPFLLELLCDRDESQEVRIHVVQQLRGGTGVLVPTDRPAVTHALTAVVGHRSSEELRLQALLALGDFTAIEGVLRTLGAVALTQDESIDLRYAAFTAIQRAGPTDGSIAVMREIAADETLGDAARSVLSAWHVT